MIKDLIRVIGLSLIISGSTLFFLTEYGFEDRQTNESLQAEVNQLQQQLTKREKEIAKLQTSNHEMSDDKKDEKDREEQTKKTFKLTIEEGDTSQDIARILEEHQLIKDANTFNKFIKEEGFSTKIQVGTYTLDNSMSMEKIVQKIITK